MQVLPLAFNCIRIQHIGEAPTETMQLLRASAHIRMAISSDEYGKHGVESSQDSNQCRLECIGATASME